MQKRYLVLALADETLQSNRQTGILPLRTVSGSGIMETSKILLHEEITEQNPSKQLIILFVQRA
ncbi:MAG: hypothetical protein CVV48_10750 [Spirochaetae bacterium HGW-Spirochaetae-4]|jgi:hypothetical protein|nr:MAG: hypothetical protein CVV48_10750 [Spirochaetae bacterium HGW-Spirochaetae-4]